MEVFDDSGHVVDPSTIDLSNPGGYRFRQRPGGSNSLGLVKFMFPNQYNVYLHDTPADSLFARASRSLSHGCVRVEEPARLAQYLLRDQSAGSPARVLCALGCRGGVPGARFVRAGVPGRGPRRAFCARWGAGAGSPSGATRSNPSLQVPFGIRRAGSTR